MLSDRLQSFQKITPRELVLWEKPQATGVVVAAILVFLFLLGYLEYTVLTLVCRFFQFAAALWFIATQLGHPPSVTPESVTESVNKAFSAAEPKVVSALSTLVDVVSWKDTVKTTKVLGATIVAGFLGTVFSDTTLALLATIGVFAGPVTYVNNREVIDAKIDQVRPMINDLLAKIPSSGVQKVDNAKKDQ